MSQEKNGLIITAQTGLDETFLIGTKEQLLDFAQSVINSAEKASESKFFGMAAKTSHLISSQLDSRGDVIFEQLVTIENDQQKIELLRRITNDV